MSGARLVLWLALSAFAPTSALADETAAPATTLPTAPAGAPLPSPAPAAEPAATPSAAPSAAPSAKTPSKNPRQKKRAAKAKGADRVPPLLQEVERQYSKAATLTADFAEVDEIAALDQKKRKSGRIRVRRPDRFRWEITQPDQSLLVSDGHKYWYYTPPFEEGEHGQVVEQAASQVQSRLLSALLTGSFSAAIRSLRIEQRGPAEFMMLPRHGSAGTVREALIQIDPERKLITRVELLHEGGNRTEISLSGIKLGEKLPDELFKFTPPPNTDRVSG